MSNVLRLGRKVLTSVVTLSLVLSLAPTLAVHAFTVPAECPSDLTVGTQVKTPQYAAMYVVDGNGKLRYFDDGSEYKTWQYNYTYKEISRACLEKLGTPAGFPASVNRHPGMLVKYVNLDKLFLVGWGNRLQEIDDATAKMFWGNDYKVNAKLIGNSKAVATAAQYTNLLFNVSLRGYPNFTCKQSDTVTVAPVASGMVGFGMHIKTADGKMAVVDSKDDGSLVLREVMPAAMSANYMSADLFVNAPASSYKDMTWGNPVTGMEARFADKTQSGWDCGKRAYTGVVASDPNKESKGDLTLSVSASTPGQVLGVPLGASNVDVLKFDVRNPGSDDLTLDSLMITRKATEQIAGSATGISVSLYDGDTRIASTRSIQSDTQQTEFANLSYVVKAGQTRTLTLRMQVASTASTGAHQFGVVSGTLTSAGKVVGTPVTGNRVEVNSGITAGTITLAKNGSVTNPKVGDSNAELTQFKLTVASEDANLKSITLKEQGTIELSNLSDIKLYDASGTQIPATVTMNNDKSLVTLSLTTPYLIPKGDKVFSVKGAISGNTESSRTIIFTVAEATDIVAIGTQNGFGLTATVTSMDDTSEAHTLTVQGGGVTISNQSAPAHDVKVNTTQVELGRVALTSKVGDLTVQKMTAQLATTQVENNPSYGTYKDAGTTGQYDSTTDTILISNIKIAEVVTNAAGKESYRSLTGSKAITDADSWANSNDASTTLTFTWNSDYFNLKNNQTRKLALIADISSSQISNVKHTVTFRFGSDYFTVKDKDDKAVTDIVPAGDIVANQVTTRAASLSFGRAASPDSATVVKGAKTVDSVGIVLTAGTGTGNDVKVTSLNLRTFVDSNASVSDGLFVYATERTVDANELVTNVWLYNGTTLVAGPASPDSSGNVTFDSNKIVGGYITIPAGQAKTLVARAEVSGNAPYGSVDNAYSFNLKASDITAVDPNGSSITATGTTKYLQGTDVDANSTSTVTVAQSIRITSSGSITSSADASKPTARVLVAQSMQPVNGTATDYWQEVHRVKLAALKEDFRVETLTIGIAQSGSYDDLKSLRLFDTNGNALSAATAIDGFTGLTKFTGLNLTVPANKDIIVVVKAQLADVGARSPSSTSGVLGSGADTGELLQFTLDTTTDNFRAVGLGSSTVDTAADAATSNTHIVRKAYPKVTVSGGGTGLGDPNLFRFKVKAIGDTIQLAQVRLSFTLNDSDGDATLKVATDTIKIYRVLNGSRDSTSLGSYSGGISQGGPTTSTVRISSSSTPVVIPAGEEWEFEVDGTVSGNETSDSIIVALVQDTGHLTGNDPTGTRTAVLEGYGGTELNVFNLSANTAFVWSDLSADTDAVSSQEWANSYLLQDFDTQSRSLRQS